MRTFRYQLFRLFILLAIITLLFAAGRIIFYFSTAHFFEAFSFSQLFFAIINGFEYDVSIVLILNSLFIFLFLWPSVIYNSVFYQSLLKFLFVPVNLLALFINLIDVQFYMLEGHRLRAFELKTKIQLLVEELAKGLAVELNSSYLNLLAYYLVFVVIIWFSSRLIKRTFFEEKSNKRFRRWISTAVLLLIAVGFTFKQLNKENFLQGLYLKADRKLAPLVMNNPYVSFFTWGKHQLDFTKEWEPHKFNAKKHYGNEKSIDFKKIKLVVIEQNESNDNIPEEHYFPIYSLNAKPNSLFQLLDEVLLSFPGVFKEGFYHSAYSLNKFESLVNILGSKGYNLQLEVVGYPEKWKKIIRNFYGFNNDKQFENHEKSFQLLVVNAGSDENNTHASSAGLLGEDELVIRLDFEGNSENNKVRRLKRTISFTSLKKMPFYRGLDSLIAQPMDIKPSILHLVGYTRSFTAYGESLFNAGGRSLFTNISDTSACIMMDSLLLDFSLKGTIALKKVKNTEISEIDLKDSLAVERIILENRIQALLSGFEKQLKNNAL